MNIKTRISTALIYPLGDGVAQLILQEFNLYRFWSLTFLALAFYQWEIPKWFKLLDNVVIPRQVVSMAPVIGTLVNNEHKLNWLGKTIGAMLYFNPLWIARHMFFISLGSVILSLINITELILGSLTLGIKSFLVNLPISIIGNFIVQVKLKLEYRFLGSVILTSLFTICYALAYRFL